MNIFIQVITVVDSHTQLNSSQAGDHLVGLPKQRVEDNDNAEEVPTIFFKPATPAPGLSALHDGDLRTRL